MIYSSILVLFYRLLSFLVSPPAEEANLSSERINSGRSKKQNIGISYPPFIALDHRKTHVL